MARRGSSEQFDPSGTHASHAPTRVILLALLAACCAVTLFARTYVEFERIRLRVVTSEQRPVDGRVTVLVTRVDDLVGRPTSVVLWIENRQPVSRDVAVRLDGGEVHRAAIGPEQTSRVDLRLATGFTRADGNTLELVSPGDAWSLQVLEVGNAYGFSSGTFSFVIVPTGTSRYRAVPAWAAALAGVALFWVSLRWGVPIRARAPGRAHRALALTVLAVLLATLVLPLFSMRTVLLSAGALGWCVAILYLPVLLTAFVRARTGFVRAWRVVVPMAVAAATTAVRFRFAVLQVAAVGVFLVSVAGFYDARHGFTSLVGFGSQFAAAALPALRAVPHAIEDSAGYDGQFYAQLALDPLTRDPAIETALDSFSYRARRILFSWTAFGLGLGQPQWIVHAYAVQNIICWLVLAVVLRRWLRPTSPRTLFAWLACLFSHGLLASVTHSLLEGPSLLLLALALIAVEGRRRWLAAGVLAFAGLGRETNVLAGSALVDWPPRLRALGPLAAQALAIGMPLVLWLAYLRLSHPDASFNLGSSGNFAAPLAGYLGDWRDTVTSLRAEGWASFARFDLLALTSVTVQAVFFAAWRDWTSPWYRVGLTYTLLMIVLGPAVWEGTPGAFTRVLLPMTCAFNIVLVRLPRRIYWPLAILGNLTVVQGLEALRTPFIWTYL
ncbi:MAG TPA: hypothetical protein VMM93_00415 [Vicinamibacterales bacterium]|nr:hypothetical protein [Vicinamibacterales bacterium]